MLTERSPGIPAWDEMSDLIKPALARQMEVYAGFLAYADHHVGRLLDAYEELGILDDTLVYVIIGDNGASAEGSMHGTTNEGFTINHMNEIETEQYVADHIDDIGTPSSYNHYAVGWAHAMDTPYQWTSRSPATGAAPQRHDRQLAERRRGEGRHPQSVLACHRCRPTVLEAGRYPRTDERERCDPASLRGDADELHVRGCGRG